MLEILSKHKWKMLFGIAASASGAAGILIPRSLGSKSLQNNKEESVVESNHSLSESSPIAAPIQDNREPELNKEDAKNTLSGRFMTLKNRRHNFGDHVSNQIQSYKSMINSAGNYKVLESEFKKCMTQNPVANLNIEEEENRLKNSYQAVKNEIFEYEGIQKEDNELSIEMNKADMNQSEESYRELKNKFDIVADKYKSIIDKKTDKQLLDDFSNVYSKLKSANDACSIKDIIRMNDDLGRQNDLGKWWDKSE